MDEPKEDESAEIAHWLVATGRRHRAPSAAEAVQPAASSEDLVRYLEELTGRQLRSREAVLRLLKDFREEDVEATRIAARHQVVREGLLLGVLAASYLHYYYWEVELQIASLPVMQVFVPVPPPKPDQHTYYLARAA